MEPNLESRSREAVRRLKLKLFSRFSAKDLHIDEADPEILAPIESGLANGEPSLGGLKYRLNLGRPAMLTIQHSHGDQINVSISREMNGVEITRLAITVPFRELDQRTRAAILMVKGDEG